MQFLPSVLSGSVEFSFRENLFTPWLDTETLQANTERMVQLGMIPLYTEYDSILGFRELYWRCPVESWFEVRSARELSEFLGVADKNLNSGKKLSTLQISDNGLYSSVWLDPEGDSAAMEVLPKLGISAAEVID